MIIDGVQKEIEIVNVKSKNLQKDEMPYITFKQVSSSDDKKWELEYSKGSVDGGKIDQIKMVKEFKFKKKDV
jgi:hypothetical protein